MKIIRDSKEKIIQIIREESDGDDVNITEVFKAEVETDKEIAIAKFQADIAKSHDRKEVFLKAIQSAPTIIGGFPGCNYEDPDFMPPFEDEDQLEQHTDPKSQVHRIHNIS